MPVRAIASASLNAWASPDDVEDAVRQGARWLWGPSRGSAGELSWDLPLPDWWPEVAERLGRRTEPMVLATGHSNADGRRALARFAATSGNLKCSVTHSLFLPQQEVAVLRDLGCIFEVDLYTGAYAVPGHARPDVADGIRALREAGCMVYLTTDAGQPDTGDPYAFSALMLGQLARSLGDEVVDEVAVTHPQAVAVHAIGPSVP